MIILKNNRGFKWLERKGIYIKGYIYYHGKLLSLQNTFSYIEKIESYKEFIAFIQTLNGSFSIIVTKKKETWFAVDRARSIPLFYTIDGNFISDSTTDLINCLKNKNYDDISICEQILSSFVYGENTAIKEIKQLQLGHCAKINNEDKKITIRRYYTHYSNIKSNNEDKLLINFDLISQNIFKRLVDSLDGRRVVIPLSGGYDSRYIVAMLKKLNYQNVVCYTYGDINQYEVQYSKKIAEKLNYEWYCIEYTDDKWKEIYDDEFLSYCEYCNNFSSVPHIQEFIALMELKKKNIIKHDDIIVNGFCGDLPAGSFVKSIDDIENIEYSFSWLAEYIFDQNYLHVPSTPLQKELICSRIKQELKNMNIPLRNFDDFISLYECWFTGARPSKWVVNSNRIYEYFGLEWRMPLWDNEFIEFWYSVSNILRMDTYLYQKYLFDYLFIPLEIDMKKPNFTKKQSLKYEKSFVKKFKMFVLHIISLIQLYFGVTIYKRNDVNNYMGVTLLLMRKIKNRKLLNHKAFNAHQMMAFWWCEKKYGEEKIRKLFKEKRRYE